MKSGPGFAAGYCAPQSPVAYEVNATDDPIPASSKPKTMLHDMKGMKMKA